MKQITLIILIITIAKVGFAQHTLEGKIEYERKTNLHRTIDYMEEDSKKWIEKFRSKIPKYKSSYFDLQFNLNESIYKPGREAENTFNMWFTQTPASENIVHTDFKTGNVVAQKQVYEQKFLVKDSMRKLKWKIKDEVRTIANYKCRKAVAVMYDSVYVVAFYSEDIPTSGGPEMFSGLPGMVLQIAIPRLHTTWIATKVELTPPTEKDLKEPAKGKEITQKDMYGTLSKSFERWGKYADRAYWWALL